MKNIVLVVLQIILFLLVFGIGSLLPPFHIEHVLSTTPTSTRIFIADGLILMFVLYLLLILIAALRKRLIVSAPWTTLAFVLAAALGFAMKFGFLTRSAF
jgi:hypothetical protein